MPTERHIVELPKDCAVTLIPSGMAAILAAGENVMVTQALGTSLTVQTPAGYLARIEGRDLASLGLDHLLSDEPDKPDAADPQGPFSMDTVNEELRTVYDPEIPINIVDLGLIYKCEAVPVADGGNRMEIEMTMTAPGCGMGDVLADDIKDKLLRVSGVAEVDVEVVFEPQWTMEHMSEVAKLQLGLY